MSRAQRGTGRRCVSCMQRAATVRRQCARCAGANAPATASPLVAAYATTMALVLAAMLLAVLVGAAL